jgi:DNA-directed RNA polymerase specialized sigma24 family protein
MDTGYNNSDLRIKDAPYSLKDMYNDYAPKLLGYILPVVNNRNLAEDCVVKIFTRISNQIFNYLQAPA